MNLIVCTFVYVRVYPSVYKFIPRLPVDFGDHYGAKNHHWGINYKNNIGEIIYCFFLYQYNMSMIT